MNQLYLEPALLRPFHTTACLPREAFRSGIGRPCNYGSALSRKSRRTFGADYAAEILLMGKYPKKAVSALLKISFYFL